MQIFFTKMHGLGNDFVVLDGRDAPLPILGAASVAALANRRTGIGCDQLIVIEPSATADFRMRIFNADGGEVEACGNAARAVGVLHGKNATIETLGGTITTSSSGQGVSVDMGAPALGWEDIPLAYAMDTHAMPVAWEDLAQPIAVNVGNPHVVFFVDDHNAIDLARLGPQIENDPIFPQRVNVNVATIINRHKIGLRVWERGVGLTQACGTGACATAVAAIRRGLADSPVEIGLPGGTLEIEWGEERTIVMTGPATQSYQGSFCAADYGLGV